jgi:putative tryptophan/tyrosine transport system substrate-binding protein
MQLRQGLLVAWASREDITGLSFLNTELEGKRLELLKETVPRISRVAVLYHGAAATGSLAALDIAGRSLGLQLQIYQVKGLEDFDKTGSAIKKQGAEALQV